jgi:hypothetical protein
MNIFHCCVQKSASQWMRRILSDKRVLDASGLTVHWYNGPSSLVQDHRPTHQRTFAEPFPKNTIVTPLYITFENFCSIPKCDDYRAFFVMRDPRDLIVSWYFSTRYSHPPSESMAKLRDKLSALSTQEGLLLSIDILSSGGYFQPLITWIDAPEKDPKTKIVKFEDLTNSNNFQVFKSLFDHCEIHLSNAVIQQILVDYSFENLTDHRPSGIENKFSNFRKGIEGDWVNHFDELIEKKFEEVVGDLPYILGYRTSKIELLKRQLAQAQLHLQQAHFQLQQIQSQSNSDEIERSPSATQVILQPPLTTEHMELNQAVSRLHKTMVRLKFIGRKFRQSNQKVKKFRQRLKKLRRQLQKQQKLLQQKDRQLHRAKTTIKTLKFGKVGWIRTQWHQLKNMLLFRRDSSPK